MKTEQEQIEEIVKILLEASKKCFDTDCNHCDYQNEKDCNQYRKTMALVQAGYGDISEYKAEIERVKAEYEKLQTNAEILAQGVRDFNRENYELTEKIKQAQIDVLNELKEKCKFDGHTVAVYRNDIEEMIEELKK